MPQVNTLSVSAITGVRQQSAAIVPAVVGRLPLLENLLTGLEVEAEHVEGDAWLANNYGWDTGGDGSLRHGGIEWRLARPMYGRELSAAINGLYGLVEAQDISFEGTPRAGTHIHVNMTDQNFDMVQAMAAIMYCIDQLVFEWADDNRMWCSYCNSMNTLPVAALQALFREEVRYGHASEVWPIRSSDRYYGFNITSLFKYGTLEFRYFPTTTSVDKLWSWVDFTHLVFKGAQNIIAEADGHNIKDYVLNFAFSQPSAFLDKLFSEKPEVLRGLSVPDYARKISDAAEELASLLSLSTNVADWVEMGEDANEQAAEAPTVEVWEEPTTPSTEPRRPTPLTMRDVEAVMRWSAPTFTDTPRNTIQTRRTYTDLFNDGPDLFAAAFDDSPRSRSSSNGDF